MSSTEASTASSSTTSTITTPVFKNLHPRIVTINDFNGFLLTDVNNLHVAFFYATWDESSKPGGVIDTLINKLTELNPQVRFGKIEAEEAAEISEQFEVSVAPTVIFFKTKQLIDKVEGADATSVTQKVEKWIKTAVPAATTTTGGTVASLTNFDRELDRLVNASPIMLFMKGTANEPKCKFSRQIIEILTKESISYGTFDILTSEAVRQGLKDKFNWPTYPQLYINGKLVGGLDIVKELQEAGELTALFPSSSIMKASSSSSSSSSSSGNLTDTVLLERVQTLLNSSTVIVFMKGTPEDPACGFSERMVETLKKHNIAFKTFDVLSDSTIREGVKKYSDFPTFPQLYIRGTLIGGVDILKQLQEENPGKSLAELLNAPTTEPIEKRLHRLINQTPAVLFMKGIATQPRCGFSARAVDTLRDAGLDTSATSTVFSSFDILEDSEVREGLKKYSNWPTFPQFYIEGKLIGGLDILKELQEEGELQTMIQSLGGSK